MTKRTNKKATAKKATKATTRKAREPKAKGMEAPPQTKSMGRPVCSVLTVLKANGKAVEDLTGICDAAYVEVGGKPCEHQQQYDTHRAVKILEALGLIEVADGKVAFVSTQQDRVDIHLVGADGSNRVNLTNTSTAKEDRPSWSRAHTAKP